MDAATVGQPKRHGKQRRRRSHNRRERRDVTLAAIDLGTNNCRLLIAKPQGRSFKIIDSFSRVVRLGEGLSQGNELNLLAMDRTMDALKVCAEKVARHSDIRLRGVATEACRRALNGLEFLTRVRQETGIRLDAISATEEAQLTLTGVQQLMDQSCPYALVFDIGGGSTEVMWVEQNPGSGAKVLDVLSVPDGVVTLAERFGLGAVPSSAYEQIMAHVDGYLASFDAANGISKAIVENKVQMLGTSGTVTTLGGIHLGLPRYNRKKVDGLVLGHDVIHEISTKLASMTVDERINIPCIGIERAELVVMGCAILEAITRRWRVGSLQVADRGIREGLLVEMMAKISNRDIH